MFTGGQSVKFRVDFRHHSSLSGPHFERKQHTGDKVTRLVQRWRSSQNSVKFGYLTLSEEYIDPASLPPPAPGKGYIINNSSADCSIAFKFGTGFLGLITWHPMTPSPSRGQRSSTQR